MNTVLITGASSGIGYALMEAFAGRGHDVVAVAHNQEKLEAAVKRCRSTHEVRIVPIAIDLTEPDAPERLYSELKDRALSIDILVNNAGVAYRSTFTEAPLERITEMLQVNIVTLTLLTRFLLPDMLARGSGRILNVGSIAGFQPGPLLATYAASKAFVVSFTEALAEELIHTPITVTCLAPGPVDTPLFARANMLDTRAYDTKLLMKPETVAQAAYEGVMAGERLVLPGNVNKAITFSRRVLPQSVQARLQKLFYESRKA